MRKWHLTIAALFFSASAQAHVSAVPFPEIGSLSDVTHQAAFFMPQTYLPSGPARTQKNLVADYGATCNAQSATKVSTISAGSPNLAVSTNTFVSGDVGKTILIPGADSAGGVLLTTISAFVDAQHVTLGANAVTALSSASTYLTWAADDTNAFLAFKAAFQGSTPVQLNIPGNCSFLPQFGNSNAWTFDGATDLIVAGNGAATSGIVSLSTGGTAFLLGSKAQFSDNLHSVRTATANAGDSCVLLTTAPAVTISAITNNLTVPATFTASMSGTTMTVTAVASGTIAAGAYLTNQNSQVSSFTAVQPYGTAGTTGVGGTGTYAITASQSWVSQTFTTVPATFTATVDAAGLMTVSAVTDGALAVGMNVYRASGSIGAPTTVKSQLTGSAGSTGTYQLSNAPSSALATPSGFIGNGSPRVTLNSTAGLTTGDTIYLTGIVGLGQLPQRTNGMQWIKVINGTQIDLFQRDFNGSYTSGGTGGGDRTSLFPIGAKVLMTGWNNQSYWSTPYSQPTNPHWFEWKTVTSNNSTTHQVCFDTTLANTYKSTWPQLNTGNANEMDPGGPATLYIYPTSWDATIVFKDLTIDGVNGQSYSQGRNVTFQNATFTGIHCPVPTQNETYTWTSVDASGCQIETDKIVKTWNITNSTIRRVTIQSSAFDTINISGSTVDKWIGSPKKLNTSNFTITCSGCVAGTDTALALGTVAYGVSDESICTTCSIGAGDFSQTAPAQQVNATGRAWSMSGGVITIPNSYSWDPCCNASEIQTRVFVPGHYAVWLGGGGGGTTAQAGRIFKVIDVTQDVDNTYIQTSEAGGFPTGAWTTNGLSVQPHPAPKLTVSFTGSSPNSALIFNGCPAQAPMFSCQNFTYTGSATGSSTEGFRPTLWGVIDTFTFTNNVPFTGGGALGWTPTRFGNWQVLPASLTTTTWGNTNMINTKLPSGAGGGTRTLTSAGATGTQAGDTIPTPPSDGWFGGSTNGPIFTANTPSDSPQVTMTLRTNQQLP